jgi:hypothetical protein
MDTEVSYTTLEPKWQLVRGHVRTGSPLVPAAQSKPWRARAG